MIEQSAFQIDHIYFQYSHVKAVHTGSRKQLAPEGEDAYPMHRNVVDSPNLSGGDLAS